MHHLSRQSPLPNRSNRPPRRRRRSRYFPRHNGTRLLTWISVVAGLLLIVGLASYILFPQETRNFVNHNIAVSISAPDETAPPPTPILVGVTPNPTPSPHVSLTHISPTPTPAPTDVPISSETPAPTLTPIPAIVHAPTPTPPFTPTASPTPSPGAALLSAQQYVVTLINSERVKAGLSEVVLGDNLAAQLHAEASLRDCISGHWGLDGLKPYMRYTLAGGTQYNAENASGLDYCIRSADGYSAHNGIRQESREAMGTLMESQGHRRNILDPLHRKVNVGLAWDSYNVVMIQQFEGDYIEFTATPTIASGILSMSGILTNGAEFVDIDDLYVQVYYDPPPHALTRGQASRTYCYDRGLQVGAIRRPLTDGSYWTRDSYPSETSPCPNPYDVPSMLPGARSVPEAHNLWRESYIEHQTMPSVSINVPWITASGWSVGQREFSVRADVGHLLAQNGAGVYTITLSATIGGEYAPVSDYSIFHGTDPPSGYGDGTQGI